MFTTVQEVEELTGYAVNQQHVNRAQAIIEAYVGRTEPEVVSAHDKMLLGRATAYQSVYMLENGDTVFEHIGATQIMQFGQMMTFPNDKVTPWVAPLAILACQRLSWKRIRSVKTGTIYHTPVDEAGWRSQ